MFDKQGIISIEANQTDEDRLMEIALEAGAEDVGGGEDGFEVVTAPDSFDAVHTAIEKAGIAMQSAEVTLVPKNTVNLSGKEAEQVFKLLDLLQEHDDIQTVSANCEFSEEDLERLSAA